MKYASNTRSKYSVVNINEETLSGRQVSRHDKLISLTFIRVYICHLPFFVPCRVSDEKLASFRHACHIETRFQFCVKSELARIFTYHNQAELPKNLGPEILRGGSHSLGPWCKRPYLSIVYNSKEYRSCMSVS